MRSLMRVGEKRWCRVEVELQNGRLSICGTAGDVVAGGRRRSADSFGQIRSEIAELFPEVVPYFKWHLNDMHAECVHQEARGETWTTHPEAVCPDCGYKLGHAWTKRDLPADVITWAETFGEETARRS